MKDYTAKDLQDMSEEELDKAAKEFIEEYRAGMVLSFDNTVFAFKAANSFEVSDQKLYLNVVHPDGEVCMECVQQTQPTNKQWASLQKILLEDGFRSAIMMCIGEGDNSYDFHIRHSNSFLRLFYVLSKDGDLFFFDSEEITVH